MTGRNVKILALSIAIVITLTALQYRYLSLVLFYFLYPGDVLGLVITGGHGGSYAEETLASVLRFLVNVCVYWLILTCGVLAFQRVRGAVARKRGAEN